MHNTRKLHRVTRCEGRRESLFDRRQVSHELPISFGFKKDCIIIRWKLTYHIDRSVERRVTLLRHGSRIEKSVKGAVVKGTHSAIGQRDSSISWYVHTRSCTDLMLCHRRLCTSSKLSSVYMSCIFVPFMSPYLFCRRKGTDNGTT